MTRLALRLLAAALSLCLVVPALAQVQPGQSPLSMSKGGTGAPTASGARTNLGLAIGTNVQAWDADLDALAALSGTNTIYYRSAANAWTGVTIGALLQFSGGTLNVGDAELVAIAGLTSANNKCFYWTGSGTAATYDCSSYGRGLINAADASAARTTLALVIGTDVQAWDAELAAIAGLATAANKCTYWSGTATAALYDCTSYGRSLANTADASALRTLGGLVIGTDVQGYDSDLGALSANSTNGLWARTGTGTGAARSLTAPAAGITVSNGDGVSGNPTLALANDLSAIEGLSGTGIARRTGTDAWSVGTTVALSEGGTGQASAKAARGSAGLNIESCTSTGDADYSIQAADRCIYHTSLSAARTDTLPAANSVNAGQGIYIADFVGVASGSNTITLQRSGSDTINGATTIAVLNAQFGSVFAISDGSSRWTILSANSGGGGGGGVTSVTAGNGLDGGVITTSGTVSARFARQFMLPL